MAGGGDSYRPASSHRGGYDRFDHYDPRDYESSRFPHPREPPPHDREMFYFKGAASGNGSRPDSYRPQSYRPEPYRQDDRPNNHYYPPPPQGPRHDERQGWRDMPGDRYQPGPDYRDRPASFNFQPINAPAAPSFEPRRHEAQQPRDHIKRRRLQDGPRGRPHRRGRPGASDRAILKAHRSPTPEQLHGMNGGQARFKTADDLDSDEEGEPMDLETSDSEQDKAMPAPVRGGIAEDEDESEDDHPRAKRAKLASPAAADARPKWSNPDVYTSLPPPGETGTRGKDVMDMIRKAKLDAQAGKEAKSGADEFISLNFDEDLEDGETASNQSEDELNNSRPFSHLDRLHGDRSRTDMTSLPSLPNTVDTWPPPPPPPPAHGSLRIGESVPGSLPPVTLAVPNKRKRKRFDEGDICEQWQVVDGSDSTPWLRSYEVEEDGRAISADILLHREIRDFYDYVQPRDFEHMMRLDLVHRLDAVIKARYPDVTIFAFGSFAARLYLPTADMDLVALSSGFSTHGRPSPIASFGQRNKLAKYLNSSGIVRPSSLIHVPSAKVPLIKYVDHKTGLQVDLSFENDSGIRANTTFGVWKDRFPAMPMVACLIKQYLAMRSLNEVHSGGLGGFSIICLVVTIVHDLEAEHGQDWRSSDCLDALFLKFLRRYGEEFNVNRYGIDMKTFKYVAKSTFVGGKRPKPDRLLIIDPNRSNNDISGGTGQIGRIFGLFKDAYNEISRRMNEIDDLIDQRTGGSIQESILGCLFAGDYSSFAEQRLRMQRIYDQYQLNEETQGGQNSMTQQSTSTTTSTINPPPRALPQNPSVPSSQRQPTKARSPPPVFRHHGGDLPARGPPLGPSSAKDLSGQGPAIDHGKDSIKNGSKNIIIPQGPKIASKNAKVPPGPQTKATKGLQGQQSKHGDRPPSGPQAARHAPPANAKSEEYNLRSGKRARDDGAESSTAGTAGPEPQPKKAKKQKKKETAKQVQADKSRANTFRLEHPGISVDSALTRQEFRTLMKKHASAT